MDQALGLALLAAYIVGVVALAAAITWVVVKLFPTERGDEKTDGRTREPSSNDSAPGGRLFRRAKRGSA